MNNTKLIQLIRESIQEYVRNIDEAGNMAALEAKMNACQEAIEERKRKINMDGIDETMHEMIDKKKIKELEKEIKHLEKSLAKYEKQLEKMKNKGKKSEEPTEEKKEIVDEINLDETFPEAGSQLEETELNESFLHMQKLAGLITESEYKKKVQALNEEESLQQYAQKIANQHNLMLLPQPLEKPALYNMWKKEKGSFGDKEGVMTFIPNSKIVNVLSSDEKIPGAVFAQFKTDRGGNDQGFETKTFSEFGQDQKGYFKNFQITG